ncbi:hypothetical protein NVS47_12025 [Dehalobacterium formicoaceticum]|uniref:Uncharacterized protein n=1 Tax=Dehalobacterium formicoaceticum TaxID=51515 RepID=A0ABT1Y5R5_9FIRM|nr:hypothetical protein [Dehalobacterium formicoaceticum]MCR6546229.1 hypothetical protein [Dehalobacterium formicoaceticum]
MQFYSGSSIRTNQCYSNCGRNLALKSDGTIWSWGKNNEGQLGDNSTTNRYSPVQIEGLTGVVGVAADDGHSLSVTSDGSVWFWGWSGDGAVPVEVPTLSDMTAISGGLEHNLALKDSGKAYAWGMNYYGQIGD